MIFVIARPMACNSSCIVFGEVVGEVPFITTLYGLEMLGLIKLHGTLFSCKKVGRLR